MTTKKREAVFGRLICEVCEDEGPTGEFREVTVASLVDAGGNEYGRATTAAEASRKLKKLRIPVKLGVISAGSRIDDPNTYDVYCGYWAKP